MKHFGPKKFRASYATDCIETEQRCLCRVLRFMRHNLMLTSATNDYAIVCGNCLLKISHGTLKNSRRPFLSEFEWRDNINPELPEQ